MTRKHTAKCLTDALYSVSESNNVLDAVYNALTTLNELVRTESQFRTFIQSKRINKEDKVKILNTVLGEFGQPLVSELVSHFEGSQASHQLQDVTNLFDRRYKVGKSIVSVEGTVASELDESEIVSLKSSLNSALGKNIDLSLKVDDSLIGGIRLRIENTFLDATVQNQLYTLKQELLQS